MDVGVDTHDFRPWHFDEINKQMASKTETMREGEQGDRGNEIPDA